MILNRMWYLKFKIECKFRQNVILFIEVNFQLILLNSAKFQKNFKIYKKNQKKIIIGGNNNNK